MILRFQRLRTLALLLAAAVAVLPAAPVRADTWNVVRYENRDYLTLRNVADFYRLTYPENGRGVELSSPGCYDPWRHRFQGTHHQRGQVHHEQRPRGIGRQRPAFPARSDQTRRTRAAAQPHPWRGRNPHGRHRPRPRRVRPRCDQRLRQRKRLRARRGTAAAGPAQETRSARRDDPFGRHVHPAPGARGVRQSVPRRHLRVHPFQRRQRVRDRDRDLHAGPAFRAFDR